ncbi:MAG: hypothetical protein ACOCP8_09690, partial [archaeon]
ANIIVEKKQVGGFADVGFEKVGDEYILHIDSDDHDKFGLNKLKYKYAEANVKREVNKSPKYTIVSSEEEEEELVITLNVNY